ncbi:MAG: hypothetical protein HY543_03875 [Deltaproteobacteria bacterium]|nr:hypothetical protein [Deltaproteobacteria bacterium]
MFSATHALAQIPFDPGKPVGPGAGQKVPPAAPPKRGANKVQLPGGCEVKGGWVIYQSATGKAQIPTPSCVAPDGLGTAYTETTCVKQGATALYALGPKTVTKECPKEHLCYQGACKHALQVKPLAVCADSDHFEPTTPWTPPKGSGLPSPTLPPDDAQIFTPGQVTVSKGATKTQSTTDSCKGPLLIEAACLAGGAQQFTQLQVQCPAGFTCNPQKVGADGFIGAACDPLCPPPFVDLCQEIAGCQLDPSACPPPDACATVDPTMTLTGAYAKAKVKGEPGNWHIDLCVQEGGKQVKHLMCKDGKNWIAITDCDPNQLCFFAECGAPEPEEPDVPACEDTDPPQGPIFGDPLIKGHIKLKGSIESDGDDYCQPGSTKQLWQAKCDASQAAGYTFGPKPTLCFDPTPICYDGRCWPSKPCSCTETPPDPANKIPGKAEGTSMDGTPFEKFDECVGEKLNKAACAPTDPNDPLCYKYILDFCPEITVCTDQGCTTAKQVCKDDVCVPDKQLLCSEVDVGDEPTVKGSATFGYSGESQQTLYDQCKGEKKVNQIRCDLTNRNGYAYDGGKPCPKSDPYCADGACVPCKDTDQINDTHVKGTVDSAISGQHHDYCPKDGEKALVQMDCSSDGTAKYLPEMDCPGGEVCQGGICVPKPFCTSNAECNDGDVCNGEEACIAGKQCGLLTNPPIVDDGNLCTTDSCDPQTGVKHDPVKCPYWWQTCQPPTGKCTPEPGCQTALDCTNKNPCDGNEICVSGQCQPGAPPKLGDGDLCTDDQCDPTTGIVHPPKDCGDGTCDPATGECKPPPECTADADCTDQEPCNGEETCVNDQCAPGIPLKPGEPGAETCFLLLSAGGCHACANFADDTVRCWGRNGYGQIGTIPPAAAIPDLSLTPVAQSMPPPADPYTPGQPLKGVTDLGLGEAHSCAVANDTLFCWGLNTYAQLGLGYTSPFRPFATPTTGGKLPTASDVDGGWFHTCAAASLGGTASCAGENDLYQLGYPTEPLSIIPQFASNVLQGDLPLTGMMRVVAGYAYSCAALTSGLARCWGLGDKGQLGDGLNHGKASPPVTVSTAPGPKAPPLANVIDLSAGTEHACALTDAPTQNIYCWGSNLQFQVGIGPAADPYSPFAQPAKTDAAAVGYRIAAGHQHTCAAVRYPDPANPDAEGARDVRCWGRNTTNQLGTGIASEKIATPVPVAGSDQWGKVVAMGAGHSFTCVRTEDGFIRCWGGDFQPLTVIGPDGVVVTKPLTANDVTDGPAPVCNAGKDLICPPDSPYARCDSQWKAKCLPFYTTPAITGYSPVCDPYGGGPTCKVEMGGIPDFCN